MEVDRSVAFYDLSIPIVEGMPCWPGDPEARFAPVTRIAAGDSANVTRLELGSHTGTHVDAPFHFLQSGRTVDQLPLEVLIGPADVVELIDVGPLVTASDLERAEIAADAERVLLKTRNSQLWNQRVITFTSDYTALSADAAAWLLDRRIRLVGIDYLSVEQFDTDDHSVHRKLLGADVIIVEGLNLTAVPSGRYQLICLPIKIVGGDGAPARVVLVEQ